MIQPGGAMALFVLRLAGLLSLEKSLGNDSSSSNETYGPRFFNVTHPSMFYATNESSSGLLPVNETSNKGVSLEAVPNSFKFNISDSAKEGSNFQISNSSKVFAGKDFTLGGNESKKNNLVDKENNFKYNYREDNTREGNGAMYSTTTQPPFIREQNKTKNFKQTSEQNPKILPTLPPRDSETGFSPVFTQPMKNDSVPIFAQPYSSPRLHDLSLSYAKLKNKSDNNFQELEAPLTDFVTKDFEYYNFETMMTAFNSTDYSPNLTSRSLVSPIPQPGHEESFLDYLEKETEEGALQQASSDQNKTSRNDDEANEGEVYPNSPEMQNKSDSAMKVIDKEVSKKRGIGPFSPTDRSHKKELERNNPYPYGPKVLPKHSITVSTSRPKDTLEPFGSLFTDSDILLNYSDEEDEVEDIGEDINKSNLDIKRQRGDQTEDLEEGVEMNQKNEEDTRKFYVKTEKPTVLFHFNKPGYSPKLPDSSLPPTRAPTPSDPWDCAPRCPSYTLLDWNQDYDIRQYPVTTWISTVIIAKNRILAELEGYMRVQDYFFGLNERGQLLNLTIPFVTQIQHGRHPGVLKEHTDFTISLYVNHIDDPMNYDLPTPISNEVLIDRLESKTVFVAGFEANVWEVTEDFLNEKATLLMEKLRQHGEAFLDRYFYLASYSRPELYQPVYYELWVYATSFRDSVISPPPIAPRAHHPPNKITSKSISKLCRGVECPPFEVLRTYRYGIQKRRYFDGLFATTSPGVCEFTTVSVWKGFMPLHLYKHGINSHMEVIEATRPIGLVHVKEDSTSTTECPQNLTMAIYLPKRLHSNPPLTGYDAPPVAISALQDVVVYAYTVGGYLLEPDRVRKELADLKYRLTEFGACFKNDEYYVVVYDFIVRYHGRQNEIWVVAENCKATLNG